MKEVKELLGLKDKKIKILKVTEEVIKGKKIKVVVIKGVTTKVKCPICNKYTKSIHDELKPVNLKFVKVAENECRLKVIKRRFICHKCKKRITEDLELNNTKRTVTNNLEIKIRKDLLKANFNIKQISEDNGVSEDKVRKILIEATEGESKYITRLPAIISIDEFKADTNEGKYACIINDPIKKKPLDVLPKRTKEYLIKYFLRIENKSNVKIVIGDMYETYLVITKEMFPNAKYVVDRFHFIRYIMDAVDNIRIRKQKEFGYNSKEYKILKNKKNVSLLRKYSNEIDWYVYVTRYQGNRKVKKLPINIINEIFDISDEIYRGYQLKEMFLDIIKHAEYDNVKEQLLAWCDLCDESKIQEFIDASNTIENWIDNITYSFLDKRYSNGYTEGLNNKIKVIKRNAYGYKNFYFFRLRILYILNGTLSGRSKKK